MGIRLPLGCKWGHQGVGLGQQEVGKPGQAGWWLTAVCDCTASQDLQSLLHHLTSNLPEACFKLSSDSGLRDRHWESCPHTHVRGHAGCRHPALLLRVAPQPQQHCERPASAAAVHSPAPFCTMVFSALGGCNLGAGEVQASILLHAFGVWAERQGQ